MRFLLGVVCILPLTWVVMELIGFAYEGRNTYGAKRTVGTIAVLVGSLILYEVGVIILTN